MQLISVINERFRCRTEGSQRKCTDLHPDCGRGDASYWWSARNEGQDDRSGSSPASSGPVFARCSGTQSPSRGTLQEEVLETLTCNKTTSAINGQQDVHAVQFRLFLIQVLYFFMAVLRDLQYVPLGNVLCRTLQPKLINLQPLIILRTQN